MVLGEFRTDTLVLHMPHLFEVCVSPMLHLPQDEWKLWPWQGHCVLHYAPNLLWIPSVTTLPQSIPPLEVTKHSWTYPQKLFLNREGFHRLSMRSRLPLVRSNTMGREEEDKIRRMNLGQKNNSGSVMPPPSSPARPKLLMRSNTTLDGSQSPASLLKTSRSRVVCRLARSIPIKGQRHIYFSVLAEMCWAIKWRKWREEIQ